MNARTVRLDFIGVGVAKAGTSWLAACLAEHPALCMAEPKELNYFCEKSIWPRYRVNHQLGPAWLAERFAHCVAGQLLGEFSPNYFCDELSPDLIYQHNPDCRLLFSLRHPVDVLLSFYHQIAKESPVPGSLEEFLAEYPAIQEMGKYHARVQRFLSRFPRKQCLFLLFDDMQSNPASIVSQCYSFLSVPSGFSPRILQRRMNESQMPRSRVIMASIDRVRRLVQRNAPPALQRTIWKLKLYRLHAWLLRRNLKPFRPPPIEYSLRMRLLEFYREDTQALADFLQRDLSHWQE